jgi:hypothetical protein
MRGSFSGDWFDIVAIWGAEFAATTAPETAP